MNARKTSAAAPEGAAAHLLTWIRLEVDAAAELHLA